MKRSLQEYVELVVFGLIALLVGTGLLWVLGWVLSLGGIVLKGLAGLLWMLLRFIVPVAIAGGLVYFLVKAAQDKQKPAAAGAGSGGTAAADTRPGTAPEAGRVIDVAPSAGAPGGPATSGTMTETGEPVASVVAGTAEDSGAAEVGDSAVTDVASDEVDDTSGALADDTDADDGTPEDEATA